MYIDTEVTEDSVWLKPIFNSLKDNIINCHKPKQINYQQIQCGDILDLEILGSSDKVFKRTFIATSNWNSDTHFGGFINLNGNQIILSDKTLGQFNVCTIGSLKN